MGESLGNKFQNMVDEMNRFEEEIGLPYSMEMNMLRVPQNMAVSQQFVIGTNTFSQAQQKIHRISHGDEFTIVGSDASLIPAQVMHASLPGGIPPPPAPPLSMPPAGMQFPPGIPMPYSQPVSTSSQQPTFVNPLMMRPDSSTVTSVPQSAPSTPATTLWPIRTAFRPLVVKPETKPSDEPPKVVLSATPKLYTPKVEKMEEIDIMSTFILRPKMDVSNPAAEVKKFKQTTESTKFVPVSSYHVNHDGLGDKKKDKKQKKCIRVSGGQTWEDLTLTEWDDGDFRLFCGDLGNDVTDELLTRIFSRYPSFSKAKVVRDKRTNKTKGFGFISFKDPQDFIRASKEMNGRYVGSRPIKLRKSTWKNRNLDVVKKKEKEKAALIAALTGKS